MAKGKGGRPVKAITPEILENVQKYAALGLTQEQIAHNIGMAPSTFQDKLTKHPELLESLKKGKATGIAVIAGKLFQAAQSGNITAQIFFLKSQAGWKENDPNAVAIQPLTIKVDGKIVEMN